MRVPLSWLREYVDVDLTPEELAERLTLLGMEVKGIERLGTGWSRVIVGELLAVERHPNSTRLSLTTVRVGADQPTLSIVCGATNIAVGQRVPVAIPGSTLPGGRRIDTARLAGVESQGMLCSGDELGLSSDADGILILPPGAPIGLPLEDLVGDTVLDVDVKPNRGDALSMVGLAREVAAATGATLRWPDIRVDESGDATAEHLSVDVQDAVRCPRFVGRYLDGVHIGPSPFAIGRRLLAAGVRPISNIVDASNYVMLELGKPIHTFDAAGIADGRIIVRGGLPGERLTTLDHVDRELDPDVLLIADPSGPLGIAGIMGGLTSEVSDTTTQVVVESAIFDPVSIRRSAFRFALRSEASLRFEKGQEHRLARLGADRTAQLILAWAGGRAAVGVVDSDPRELPRGRVPFRPARVSRLLGVDIDPTEQAALLARVEVGVEPAATTDIVPVIGDVLGVPVHVGTGDALVAIVPGHRRDLVIEADIAEEIARVRGYETLPGSLPASTMPGYRPDPSRLVDRLRDMLSDRGLTEVVTHGLIGPDDHARLGIEAGDATTIRAVNPVTVDHSELRRSLLPGLLHVLVDNERQRRLDVAIFEHGPIHARHEGVPHETAMIGVLLAGSAQPAGWAVPSREWDVADAKGIVEWIAARLGGAVVRFEHVEPRVGVEHPGRTAGIIADLRAGAAPLSVGRVGEVHPSLLEAYEARTPRAVYLELSLTELARMVPARLRIGELERLPAVERDLAFVTTLKRPAGDMGAIIRELAGPLLASCVLFDRYQGPPLAEDEVSLAWRLRFEPGDQPLDDAQLNERLIAIEAAVQERLGARRRA
jgi:phenylalanyl-tRNA synthetase beta chain